MVDEPFDPASLPSIESITVDTDIRGFLQSRVPAALTRAVLRQACDRNQVVADPFCLIQVNSPADHAIKNGRLGSVAPAQNFDGKRFTIHHASHGYGSAANTIKRIIDP